MEQGDQRFPPERVESLPGPREFPQNNGLGRNVQVFLESGSLPYPSCGVLWALNTEVSGRR